MNKDITESIRLGHNNRLKESLEENPSIADGKTESGISLLQYAVYCLNAEAIGLIKQYKKLDLDIFEAACTGEDKIVKHFLNENPALLNSFSVDGFTLLGLAAYFGHFSLAKLALENGADPNTPSNNQFRVAPLHSACSSSNYEIAELLLKNGADVNATQLQNYTPLHSAALNGRIELVKLLIDHGADVNARSDDGKTALSIAMEKGFKELSDLIKNLSETCYHGTKANLKVGDLIQPGYNSNYGQRKKAKYVYFAATLDAAIWGAELASGEGKGRVYTIEPTGAFEDDPNLTDKKFPGNPTKSYRTTLPILVTSEVTNWQGHSPEQLKSMKEHLERLKELGIEAIED